MTRPSHAFALCREAHLPRPGETYEAWLQRKTMSTDTEINVQLGELAGVSPGPMPSPHPREVRVTNPRRSECLGLGAPRAGR